MPRRATHVVFSQCHPTHDATCPHPASPDTHSADTEPQKNPATMKPNYACCVTFGLLAWLPVIHAQTPPAATQPAAPATPASPTAEEAVVLNPFLVSSSADTGYAATNTLDGSRLNTALRDTPAAIQRLHQGFSRRYRGDRHHIAAPLQSQHRVLVQRRELARHRRTAGQHRWRAGLAHARPHRRGIDEWLPGCGWGGYLYNVERVGSTRGPNAIFFGTGASGGVLNLRTKIADPRRNLNSIEFKYRRPRRETRHRRREPRADRKEISAAAARTLRLQGQPSAAHLWGETRRHDRDAISLFRKHDPARVVRRISSKASVAGRGVFRTA